MNRDYTESIILKICNKPRTIDYISQHLDGVDPILALQFLNELEKENKLRCQGELWLLEENAKIEISEFLNPEPQLYLKKYMGDFFEFFKKPHPLDFEWRNSKNSVNYLEDLVLESNSISDNVLILGMPTLFASLSKRDLAQQITIVERNKGIIDQLKELAHNKTKVIEEDIFLLDPETVGKYTTVVMDPPWYVEHFYQFIWVASRCLRLGGRLIISIPPMNTRPGIDVERIDWFRFCQSQGLCLENLFAKKLHYLMPFFEWNAIRSAGSSASPFWRNGDLAIFKKLNDIYVDRPKYTEESSRWKEIELKTIRIRVKIEDLPISQPFEIIPLTKTGILPSVSSRNPLRANANIWTSGNRIYKTSNPKKFYTFLQFIKDGIQDESSEFGQVSRLIDVISTQENEEYNNYLEWLYHAMEIETN